MRKGPGNRLTESSSSHRHLKTSKSSPGRIHSKLPEDQTSPTQNGDTSIDSAREVNHHVKEPNENNHHTLHRTRLEPLPSSYHPKIGELSKRQLDKLV